MLTDTDREIFNFDMRQIQWRTYMRNYVFGVRKYVFKEHVKNTEELHRKD